MTRGADANGGSSVSIASASAPTTERYSGSPTAPGSLVRSSTAIDRTVGGSAESTSAAGKGWNSRRRKSPTDSPAATSVSTVSSIAPAAEPITTMTRSASGAPW